MYPVLSASLNPLPAMFDIMRTGLRNQGLFAQRQLTALELLLRGAGPQVSVPRTGTPADPLLLQQTQAVTALADSVIGLARVLSDMQARSAADLLTWWEHQLGGLVQGQAAEMAEPVVERTVEPATRPVARTAAKRAAPARAATAPKRTAKASTSATPKAATRKAAATRRTRSKS